MSDPARLLASYKSQRRGEKEGSTRARNKYLFRRRIIGQKASYWAKAVAVTSHLTRDSDKQSVPATHTFQISNFPFLTCYQSYFLLCFDETFSKTSCSILCPQMKSDELFLDACLSLCSSCLPACQAPGDLRGSAPLTPAPAGQPWLSKSLFLLGSPVNSCPLSSPLAGALCVWVSPGGSRSDAHVLALCRVGAFCVALL